MRKKDSLELDFLKKLVVVLEKQNVDIPFCIACFESANDIYLYKEFLKKLHKNKFEIIFDSLEKLEDGSSAINVKVLFERCSCDKDWRFSFQERLFLMGYCNCSIHDQNYSHEKDCCGIACDWVQPVMKITYSRQREFVYWSKTQREYWQFEEEFYKEKEKNEKSL